MTSTNEPLARGTSLSDARRAQQIHLPKRGELLIYLGAAPGVGKTYAMLGEAHRRLALGTDLVGAVVETHGRKETADLLEGIEMIPPRYIEYRGQRFPELDVEAVLRRQPQVVLVDELAHTNIPGSKNPKRWQDVEELLDAGITVISTVNIQHLESLNDVVAQITGIEQHETVPDEVVRSASQVDLVDITPEALRRRLSHGNVYAAERIGLVPSKYSSGNTRTLGGVTKTGNRHARRLLVEAAWRHRSRYLPGAELRRRWDVASPAARARGQAANRRLHTRWSAFDARQKRPVIANVAIARELAGWCWSLAVMPD